MGPLWPERGGTFGTLLSGWTVQTGHLILVACVLLECALFVGIGVWRFNKQEL